MEAGHNPDACSNGQVTHLMHVWDLPTLVSTYVLRELRFAPPAFLLHPRSFYLPRFFCTRLIGHDSYDALVEGGGSTSDRDGRPEYGRRSCSILANSAAIFARECAGAGQTSPGSDFVGDHPPWRPAWQGRAMPAAHLSGEDHAAQRGLLRRIWKRDTQACSYRRDVTSPDSLMRIRRK